MKIAICDDEKIFRGQLQEYLNKYYKSLDTIVESFTSGEKFLEKYMINPNAYELIFMDIEMGELDGINTAKRLREYNSDVIIIFLTSHVELALEGYEVDAFRFLSKPINERKLINALQDVQSEIDRNRKILIKDVEKEVLLKYKDIIYVEAQNVNLRIRTNESEYSIRKSLIQMEKEVEGPSFYKPHRSYLINLGYVVDYTNKVITMETGEKIPLSRNKVTELKEALMLYVKTCGR